MYDPSELTPFNFFAHEAIKTMSAERGYSGAPHWFCCSNEAKAEGRGFIYGMYAKDKIDCIRAERKITETIMDISAEPYKEWKEREISAAKTRGEISIEENINFEKIRGLATKWSTSCICDEDISSPSYYNQTDNEDEGIPYCEHCGHDMVLEPLEEDECLELTSYVKDRISEILFDDHPTPMPVIDYLRDAIIDTIADELGLTKGESAKLCDISWKDEFSTFSTTQEAREVLKK